MFEKIIRLKLRFESPKGLLTVEDLWDLPLSSSRGGANLNDIAKGLNRELKDTGEEDFVVKATKPNEVLQLKFDVVRHIIDTRLTENEETRVKADKKAQKDRLLALIARKQDEKLEGATLEDLQRMVEAL